MTKARPAPPKPAVPQHAAPPAAATADAAAQHPAALVLGGLAVVLVLFVAALRSVVPFNPDVYWATDPRMGESLSELGALGIVVLDWLGMIALALALAAAWLTRQRVAWVLVAFWLVGLGFAIGHGLGDADSLRIGSTWAGSLALALAAAHLASRPLWRRLMLAGLVAIIIPVGGQALHDVGVEHPRTIADYEAHREQFLQARGWEEGSLEQRRFEQRLYQNQATARFALGNVLGTVMAALGLAAAGILAAIMGRLWTGQSRGGPGGSGGAGGAGQRRRLQWPEPRTLAGIIALALMVLLAMAVVALTFSRGAILAVMLGVAAAAVACVVTWWRSLSPIWSGRLWAVALLAVIVASLGAVVARGMVGEPETMEGERSLLFRYHYWQAAAGMWADQPLTGVGPGRFQQQYLLHKNPLNPEDTTDPHSVFIFYIAGLGLGGLAWTTLLLGLLWLAGAALGQQAAARNNADNDAEPTAPPDASARHRYARWSVVAVVAAAAFGTQYVIELPRYWIDAAALWMVATAAWIALAGWLSGRTEWHSPLAAVGLLAAVAAMMAHAQIEMSLTAVMGPAILLALLGALAPASRARKEAVPPTTATPTTLSIPHLASTATVAIACLVALVLIVIPIGRQQGHLAEAATYTAANRLPLAADTLAAARADHLPPAPRIARQEARLRSEIAERAHYQGDTATRDAHWQAALHALEQGRRHGQLAQLWQFEAMLSYRAYRLTGADAWADGPLNAIANALEHDPHGLELHLAAADMAHELQQPALAERWYRRTLELHELSYLDDHRQLAPDDLQRVQQRLAAPAGDSADPPS